LLCVNVLFEFPYSIILMSNGAAERRTSPIVVRTFARRESAAQPRPDRRASFHARRESAAQPRPDRRVSFHARRESAAE